MYIIIYKVDSQYQKGDTNYGVEMWCFKMTAFSPGLIKPVIERICNGMCDKSSV